MQKGTLRGEAPEKGGVYGAGLALSEGPSTGRKVLSLYLWLRFSMLWFAVVLLGFVEGYVLLPFGLAAFLGGFSHRVCSLAYCAEVVAVNLLWVMSSED
jgi:hypothetical protein